MLEDVQGLDDGAAGTGPREGHHLRTPVGSAQRLALSHAVDAKIAAGDVSAPLLHIRHDRLRDPSAIEIFGADDAEPSHGLGQVRLPDPGPDIGWVLTVFENQVPQVLRFTNGVEVFADRRTFGAGYQEPLLCQRDCRSDGLGQRSRTVPRQCVVERGEGPGDGRHLDPMDPILCLKLGKLVPRRMERNPCRAVDRDIPPIRPRTRP